MIKILIEKLEFGAIIGTLDFERKREQSLQQRSLSTTRRFANISKRSFARKNFAS